MTEQEPGPKDAADDRAGVDRAQAERGGGNNRGISNADLAAASAPGDRVPGEDLGQRQDRLLDEALEETFPGSDPISPKQITK